MKLFATFSNLFRSIIHKHLYLRMTWWYYCLHFLHILEASNDWNRQEMFSNGNSIHIAHKSLFRKHYKCSFWSHQNGIFASVDPNAVFLKIWSCIECNCASVLLRDKEDDFSIPTLSWSSYCNIRSVSNWLLHPV